MIIRKAALAVLALAALAVPTSAHAATVEPYFLKNSTASNHSINVWSNSSCGGTVHPVYTGQQISSDGWDSAKASYPWDEEIRDDQTGAFLANRRHDAFECVPLSNNRHFVYVLNSRRSSVVKASTIAGTFSAAAACPSGYGKIGTWTLYRNDTEAATDYRLRVYFKKDSDEIARVGARVFKASGTSGKRVYVKIARNGNKLKAAAGTGITPCITAENTGGKYLFYGSVAKKKGKPAIASNSISITLTRP
jgi:ribosomal protein L31